MAGTDKKPLRRAAEWTREASVTSAPGERESPRRWGRLKVTSGRGDALPPIGGINSGATSGLAPPATREEGGDTPGCEARQCCWSARGHTSRIQVECRCSPLLERAMHSGSQMFAETLSPGDVRLGGRCGPARPCRAPLLASDPRRSASDCVSSSSSVPPSWGWKPCGASAMHCGAADTWKNKHIDESFIGMPHEQGARNGLALGLRVQPQNSS